MEREEIIENTKYLIHGLYANNALIYGDRGTGKSSTVKALLNEYYEDGLRIIELQKKYLIDLRDIMNIVKSCKQKFIIFVDDLALEDNEENYTALKALLEGGLDFRPQNVAIYATSNRRHFIKEKFSDRIGLTSGVHEEEVQAGDTLQEKLSLGDRFGITVTYLAPDQNKYLEIVDALVAAKGMRIDSEILHRMALQWELRHNGRSGRTAQQFVTWLWGQTQLKKKS